MRKINKIMQTNPIRTKDGFTLIELIVVIAIMGIVTSMIFSLNFFEIKTFKSGQIISKNQYEVRRGTATIHVK